MLGSQNAMASIAVKDIELARKFYEKTLGLKLLDSAQPGVLDFRSGNSQLVVYVSQYAGTNQATSATWSVGDEFDAIVQALQAKGVKFEHYDLPGLARQGDVHLAGNYKGVWFKDPDGNILHILNQ
jgi:catechol 2,3-dioxygenase-like lactoylglutathione lyase family enzyme